MSRIISIKFPTLLQKSWSPFEVVFGGQTDDLQIRFWDRFLESPNSTPTRFPFVFLIITTHQSKTRTLSTLATINRLVQINHKLYIKTNVKSIILA